MPVQRVALIFDNTLRPETTGLYCRRALGCLVDVEHFLPDQLGDIPRDGFDLYLRVDDGLNYDVPDDLRPLAVWLIDTHVDFPRAVRLAQAADFVFAAQLAGQRRLREEGAGQAVWLPLACDPAIHRPHDVPLEYDLCFVGNLLPGPRMDLIRRLQAEFPRTFAGRRYFEDMARTCSASRIVFNRSVADDLNMRVFEMLACGRLLLTNALPDSGQDKLFEPGRHLVTYTNADDFVRQARHWLRQEDAREELARSGREEVLARHTYLHRMNRLLREVEGSTQSPDPQERVSVCLLSWQRPDNVRQIVHHLRQAPFIDDIVIWNNNPEVKLHFDDPGVRVIDSPRNLVTYGRFLAVRHARHAVIYTQDDDCLVHNIGELFAAFQCDPERISHGLKTTHLSRNVENRFGEAQMALLGWGAFFHRDWCKVLDEYRTVYGEEEVLHRKADRLFSLLQGRRHRPQPADLTELDGHSGREALSLRPDHRQLTAVAVERALELSGRRQAGVGTVQPKEEDTGQVDHANRPEAGYFEHPRPEVLDLIPGSSRRVLDVGCGSGRLGESLRQRQPAEVVGLERDRQAAARAANRLNQVVNADAESMTEDFDADRFDCVVCADVLEHLRRPERLLSRIHRWLTPDGRLVISLPNLQHHSVLRSLLDGNFTYEPAGLLDVDHVRLFTRREIEKLLFRAGFQIEQMQVVPGPGYHQWREQGCPGRVDIGGLGISGLTPERAESFFVYQYLVRACPVPQPADELTSIIIVTHNGLQHTRSCLDSLNFRTDEPYELILVDNGSTDGTTEWLRARDDVRLIANTENRGFPAAVNQGLQVARGRQVLLLNNDTVLTTGWLRRMLDVLYSAPDIGLVGPCSNAVSGPQQIEVTYDDPALLDGFAWEHGRQHHRQIELTDRLVGFCLLIRDEVVRQLGPLDERFGLGCYEDDDYCRRAALAGWRCVIARDAFVHHVGSASFRAAGVDLAGLLTENREQYEYKWSHSPAAAPDRAGVEEQSPSPAVPDEFEATANDTTTEDFACRLSLCMIVRDNQHTIGPCLESIRPWVDEMIVVDTGSTDRTPDICRELGARVSFFEWCDDFSAARNESLRQARGEWLFWMDSDDTIPAECGRRLRELADGTHDPEVLGYVMQVHCPGASEQELTVVDHVKLFRNRPELRFEHRIHEQILPAIRRAGGEVVLTGIHVVHSGSDHSADGRARKLERDFRILAQDLAERPDHPFVLFNLGMTCEDAGRYAEAVDYLRRCLAVSGPAESHVRKAYALLVSALTKADRHPEADTVCREALDQLPDDRELLFRQATLHHHFRRLDQAAAAYRRILEEPAARHLASVDIHLTDSKTRHNLALVLEDQGEDSQAREQWREIVRRRPDYPAGWRGLGENLLAVNDLPQVERLLAAWKDSPADGPERQVLAARLAERRGHPREAERLLREVLDQYPGQPAGLREMCRIVFEHDSPAAAVRWLEQLVRLEPDDAAPLHNLGAAYLACGRQDDAEPLLQKSLQLRPGSAATRQLLAEVQRSP